MKHNTVPQPSDKELAALEKELFSTIADRSGCSEREAREIFRDALREFPPDPRTEQAINRDFAANVQKLQAAYPPKKAHWTDVALAVAVGTVVALGFVWLWWQVLN